MFFLLRKKKITNYQNLQDLPLLSDVGDDPIFRLEESSLPDIILVEPVHDDGGWGMNFLHFLPEKRQPLSNLMDWQKGQRPDRSNANLQNEIKNK